MIPSFRRRPRHLPDRPGEAPGKGETGTVNPDQVRQARRERREGTIQQLLYPATGGGGDGAKTGAKTAARAARERVQWTRENDASKTTPRHSMARGKLFQALSVRQEKLSQRPERKWKAG